MRADGMTLGIVGGGQLGRMMALAGAPLGIHCVVLDPSAESCARHVARHIQATYDDADAVLKLADQVTAATFEFENVPAESVARLAERVPAFPPAGALATSRDRWQEKTLFREQGIALPPVAAIDSQAGLEAAVADMGLPAVLKTRTLGYDGKGQKVLRTAEDLPGTWEALGGVPCVLEGFVDFDSEVSCIGVRGRDGALTFYDLIENHHRDGILDRSQPVREHPLQALAEEYTARVMQTLDYVGVMAFEFFRVGDQLMANEIAPRVHNSGHWTIEGARTSQFANHVRAVCGLPLGSTESREQVVMLNVYGRHPDVNRLLAIPGVSWHDYAKAARPGRKIGHVTVQAATRAQLADREAAAAQCLRNERG